MKNCPNCGKRIYRKAPENEEYGSPVVDGRVYPKQCPRCGHPL